MTEEVARQLDRAEPDQYVPARGPQIAEAVPEHDSVDEIVDDHVSTTLTDSVVDGAQTSVDAVEIVVDLRSADLEVRSERSVGPVVISEAPTIPDPSSLAPMPIETFRDVAVPPIGGLAAASAVQCLIKRTIDVVVALISLILFAPFMLVVAAMVVATSSGPALYRSTRIGKDGRQFTFLKFRTMYDGAEADRRKLESLNEQTGPVFKMSHDPRITPLGRVLRQTSIDELPQLFHVLAGTMSLVGPRPAIPTETEQYDRRTRQRLLVKPGITCIWQVSGRSTVDFDTWVDMDLEYIRSWSILSDLSLLVRTIPAVVGGKGAF